MPQPKKVKTTNRFDPNHLAQLAEVAANRRMSMQELLDETVALTLANSTQDPAPYLQTIKDQTLKARKVFEIWQRPELVEKMNQILEKI